MTILPPDRTIGTRSSARLNDTARLQSVRDQSPEEKIVRKGEERRTTFIMIGVAAIGVAAFLLLWWLAVR